jgi:hypothetical protein
LVGNKTDLLQEFAFQLVAMLVGVDKDQLGNLLHLHFKIIFKTI